MFRTVRLRTVALTLGLACVAMALFATAAPAIVSTITVKGKKLTYTQCPGSVISSAKNPAPHKDCVKDPKFAPIEAFATFKASDKSLGAADFDAYVVFEELGCAQPSVPATVVGNAGKFTVLVSHQFQSPGKTEAFVIVQPAGDPAPVLPSSCNFDVFPAAAFVYVDVKFKFDKKYSS